MGFRKWSREAIVIVLCIAVMTVFREANAYRDGPGRILIETGNMSDSVLTHQTERVDPLNDLKKYRGGFNITNKHYWSSTIFTGKFGYMIGAAWLSGGLIYALVLLLLPLCFRKHSSFERKRPNCFKESYNWFLLWAVLLTLLALIASGVALGGSSRFHSRAIAIKSIVVNTSTNASKTIYTVTDAVEDLQNGTQLNQNAEESSRIEMTARKLNDEAKRIERKAGRIMHWVSKGLDVLNAVTIATVSLNLAFILALLVARAFRLRRIVRILIVLCWILLFLLWAYFGLYYFFGKFAGDVCLALDEYKQNPGNSTLSTILPCNDRGSAAIILHSVSGRVYDLIQQVNTNITSLRSSISGIQYICNPFSGPPDYNYQPENCSSDTITIGQIPQIIENFACSGGNSSSCLPGEFIPARIYGTLQLETKSMQNILDSYPVMKSLINCDLVKDAFSDILLNHCVPLKKYVHMAWASMAALSTVMVVLILIYESERCRSRKFCHFDGSVRPNLTLIGSAEVDEVEVVSLRD